MTLRAAMEKGGGGGGIRGRPEEGLGVASLVLATHSQPASLTFRAVQHRKVHL